MPQNPSYRRDFTSPQTSPGEELYRLYGPDYDEVRWVQETLARLKIRRFSRDFSEQDEADLKRAGYILDRRKAIEKFENFNPDQPRGEDGKWIPFNAAATVACLKKKANEENDDPKISEKICAQRVRECLAAGGIVLPKINSAKDFGKTLLKAGFVDVSHAGAGQGFPPPGYTPQEGDVVVIQPGPGTSIHGHMALYTGDLWISDFFQRDMYDGKHGFWPGEQYRLVQPSYVIYRRENRK